VPIGVGSKATVWSEDEKNLEIKGLTTSELALLVIGLRALVEYESISATAAIEALDLRESLAKALDLTSCCKKK
jgi:hypothetical protein